MKKRLSVGILGATGMLGEKYLLLLQNHPWFDVKFLGASDKSIGSSLLNTPILPLKAVSDQTCDLLFSALPDKIAKQFEPELASKGFILISSASSHRLDPKTPLLIPEVNPHHLTLLPSQGGYIVSKPNCSIQAFILPLAPLHREFTIETLSVTTLQAISGAGKKGLLKADIEDNVIPFIPDEEEKVETEPLKILDAKFPITSHCNRVPVSDGHLVCVSVSFKRKPSYNQILELWQTPSELDLPFAPKYPVLYSQDPSRPQSRLDRDAFRGMSVTVGRLRECSIFDWKFCALCHNTIRGGAGGGILCAELLVQKGYLANHGQTKSKF